MKGFNMDTVTFVQYFDLFPEEVKKRIVEFADSLVSKRAEGTHERITPKFGSDPGLFIISPDFDQPLEEFKEYME